MSRLGKSLVTDTELLTLERVMAEIDAVDGDELAELAAVLLPAERLAASGVGPDRTASARARASTTIPMWSRSIGAMAGKSLCLG